MHCLDIIIEELSSFVCVCHQDMLDLKAYKYYVDMDSIRLLRELIPAVQFMLDLWIRI